MPAMRIMGDSLRLWCSRSFLSLPRGSPPMTGNLDRFPIPEARFSASSAAPTAPPAS